MRRGPRHLGHAVLVAAFALPVPARADDLLLDGIVVPGVEVIGVEDGGLVYLLPSGVERAAELTGVRVIGLERDPVYAQAVAELEAGDPAKAAVMLGQVLKRVEQGEPWVRHAVIRRQVEANAALGRGADAVSAFLRLVSLDPDPGWLTEPPVGPASALQGDERRSALDQVQRARGRSAASSHAALDALLAVLAEAPSGVPAEPEVQAPPPAVAEPAAAAIDEPVPVVRNGPLSPLVLPAPLAEARDPVVALLRRGAYADAIARLDREPRRDAGPPQRTLYLRARAQLGLAEASGRREDFLDAGLGFMRLVAVADPGGGYRGPALVDAAYVHQRLGVPDIAGDLLVESGVLLDAEAQPGYHQRRLDLLSP